MADQEHVFSAGASIGYSPTNSNYTTLYDLQEIDAPALDRDDSPDTDLDSSAKTKQMTPGWRSTGSATVRLYLTKAQFAALQTLYNLDGPSAVYFWQLTLPKLSSESTASNLVFEGYIKSIKIGRASVSSSEKIDCTVTITGSFGVTWTSGS